MDLSDIRLKLLSFIREGDYHAIFTKLVNIASFFCQNYILI